MPETIIHVEDLSKKYKLNHKQLEKYVSLRDVLASKANNLRDIFSRTNNKHPSEEDFWALKGVSFDIKRGERIGIIGRNGAGKSTLLKILSRITEPSSGFVELRGRVASLLEVGTGFHPELTGRENIFLNGAILGMSKAEITQKFDEIVAFAEVERFLNTPVKRYSSGMYVRLAFAVAAHLEPEILIVDEVLAVGDASFQKKCLGKMKEAGSDGRTVIFVSHNMAAISALCEKSILLREGTVSTLGSCNEVIAQYLREQEETLSTENQMNLKVHPGRIPGAQVIFHQAEIFCNGVKSNFLEMGGNLKIKIHFRSEAKITNPRFGISIDSLAGQRIINFSPSHQSPDLFPDYLSKGIITCDIPSLPLVPGTYYITVIIANATTDLDRINQAIQFSVEAADVFSTGHAPSSAHGVFYTHAAWQLQN